MTRVVGITVGTGSPEGANSAYLLPERGVVVDPGPPGDEAWSALGEGIRAAGCELDAVDHVVVTHWHADHTGLAPRLARAADATIHMHARDAPLLASYEQARAERLERDAAALRRWGVPEATVEAVIEGDTPSPFPAETAVESHVDGDEVAGGRLLHTPGHTAGHAALAFDGHLFVGDCLLPTYTPNVGGSDTRLANPLGAYLASVTRLERRIEECEFHPGHGETLALPDRIDRIRAHHEERTRRVSERVATRERATPWDVASDLFGELRGLHVKFGAGEAAAHLAYLREEGYVAEADGEVAVYEHRRPYEASGE
ncbi:MBL fold metallo-hydrolase [Salinigranum rubrum]|uniref:MBL fold metallo-hydrolase n=1 Tax=Salinigranum rubrum TaxID=755307 RepID=UPI001FE352B9|nr:MBL fold metallo-hydrolase [Salinigranum rubrum]